MSSSAADHRTQIPLLVHFSLTAGKTEKYTYMHMEVPSSKKETNLKSKSVSCVIIKWDNHSGRIALKQLPRHYLTCVARILCKPVLVER